MRPWLWMLAACAGEPWVPAAEYCESVVDAYCPYYLRCGRMAVDSVEECRTAFLEACNARYEPQYAALEAEGLLLLSRDGIATCTEHLENVECEQQVFDLDGGCASMWVGQTPAGGACGLGIESFVCDSASTCVIGLDLCGSCEAVLEVGAACEEGDRCDGACVDGVCVAEAAVGTACSDEVPCVMGAWCESGVCTSFSVVGVGEECDASRRCAYKSACVGGECVELPLLGEDCSVEVGCASGFCSEGACRPLREDGEACEGPGECVSGTCDATCGALPGVCFP